LLLGIDNRSKMTSTDKEIEEYIDEEHKIGVG
jgi:hypothetical protein